MTRKNIPVVTLCGLLFLAAAATAGAQETAAAAPAMSEEQKAMMEIYAKAATPGEHHEHLGHLVGSWKLKTRMWLDPGQPPDESGGTMEAQWILGGRFVQAIYEGDFMGQPFEGRGIEGYDNVSGKHISTWMDTLGTVALHFEGQCSEGGKVITMSADYVDPASGQTMTNKGVLTFVDKDHYTYESYMSGPDGNEMKVMELTATRQ